MKLLLPTTTPLDPAVPVGVERVYYDCGTPVPTEHLDAEFLVVWGASDDHVRDCAGNLRNLRWVQTLGAGPDQIEMADFPAEVVLTSGQTLHDGPVAEHTLALVLAAARRFDLLVRAQLAHRWADELGGLQDPSSEDPFTTLNRTRFVIWGFGSIASRLAPVLRALGAEVTGIARATGDRGGFAVYDESHLERLLPSADVLIMLLPARKQTHHALSKERLTLLQTRAWLINVGRGSTVDTVALEQALREGTIAGAALDVFQEEPLPPNAALWTLPNVIITPHAAGGRPVGADVLIEHNVRAILAGKPVRNLVER